MAGRITAPVVAVAVLAAVATGCAAGQPGSSSATPRIAPVRLAAGTANGTRWGLWAWEQDKRLCMALSGPDRYSAKAATNGGCGFDGHASGGYYMGGRAPGGKAGTYVGYGPLPTRAVRIRAHGDVMATKPLPVGHGLPVGRYWISFAQGGGNPQPLDARGNPVPFQAF